MDFVTTQGGVFPNSSPNNYIIHPLIPIPPLPMSSSSSPSPSPIPSPSSSSSLSSATSSASAGAHAPSRYENQKRRDWNTFCQYLRNHCRPPLSLSSCNGSHVLEFLRYLDQFGKTKVHNQSCPFFGLPNPPSPCPCPLRQAWGSLDALIGRLRAAYEEHGGGNPESNPFGTRIVRLFLRDVRDFQSKSRGISYEKKRKRNGLLQRQKVQQATRPHDHGCQRTDS